jgi:hypothetical protein
VKRFPRLEWKVSNVSWKKFLGVEDEESKDG